jgi:hypothetical protein
MKKLLVALMTSFLVATGLVAFSGAPAMADCPYTACIGTDTEVNAGDTKRGWRAPIAVRVIPNRSGNAPVRGTLVVVIEREDGGYRDTFRRQYTGPVERFKTEKLQKLGRYVVIVRFDPFDDSIYKGSVGRDSFQVERRER